jgi:hypothetical protein
MLIQLTPSQMNAGAMVNNLIMTDKGLIVYDTVRNGINMWDGTRWKGSWVMRLPYAYSLENGTSGTNMLGFKYKSTTGASVGIMYLENQDILNAFAPLFALTNSKIGAAANFISSYPENTSNAISATQAGLGRAGRFVVNNTNNNNLALLVTSNGGGISVALNVENTGLGAGIVSTPNGNGSTTAAVYGEHKGTGASAGIFRISNASNTSPALFAQTNGGGDALYSITSGTAHGVYSQASGGGNAVFAAQTGTGRAVQAQITNSANAESALRAFTDGVGRAGFFTVSSPGNTAAAIFCHA